MLRNMEDIEGMAPPLQPLLRESLLLHRIGGYHQRDFESFNSRTRQVIGLLQSWLNNHPSDHPNRDAYENALSVNQQELNLGSAMEENLRQGLQAQGDILRNLIINSYSYLVQNPPTSIHCRTPRDVEAVHTLTRIGIWPEDQVVKVAVECSAFNPIPPQYLANYAITLDLEVQPFTIAF